MINFLADPARRERYGTTGRERAVESYSVASVVDTDETVFDRIALKK